MLHTVCLSVSHLPKICRSSSVSISIRIYVREIVVLLFVAVPVQAQLDIKSYSTILHPKWSYILYIKTVGQNGKSFSSNSLRIIKLQTELSDPMNPPWPQLHDHRYRITPCRHAYYTKHVYLLWISFTLHVLNRVQRLNITTQGRQIKDHQMQWKRHKSRRV